MSRVLVALPETASQLYVQLTLREASHAITTAPSLREAVRALSSHAFDLVLVGATEEEQSCAEVVLAMKALRLADRACFAVLSDDPLIGAEMQLAGIDPVVLPAMPSVEQLLWLAHVSTALPVEALEA